MRSARTRVLALTGCGMLRRLGLAACLCLGLAGAALAAEVSLEVPAQVEPGSPFRVTWRGPDASGDFLALAAPDAAPSSFLDYARTSAGSPVTMTAPEPGTFEVRYVSAATLSVLARARLRVGESAETTSAAAPGQVEATLMALVAVDRGRTFRVAWHGPAAEGDRLAIVPAGGEPADAVASLAAAGGAPLGFVAPETPGTYEILYLHGGSGEVIARRALEVR